MFKQWWEENKTLFAAFFLAGFLFFIKVWGGIL